ncbi:hypothetical protein [Aeromicrobium panaciterrae]|uniref:hypothetical protein n=1 Tax=Aeromicrobium panaciterrae TaxID=363861 RepID=UPI0031D61E4C
MQTSDSGTHDDSSSTANLPAEHEADWHADEPFYAYLAVESAEMSLAELTEVIGFSPDRSWDIGDRSPRGVTFKVANWTKYLSPDVADRGTSKLALEWCTPALG